MKIELDYTPPNSTVNHHIAFGNNLTEMLRAGIEFAKEGNRAEARQLLLRVAETEPDNESAWMWLASISEYPEELLVFLQNVLKINPSSERALEWTKATKSMLAETFVQRGIEASQENRQEYAAHCFTQALLHDNQNESAWLQLASGADSLEEKMSHLQKVLSINPENETALASFQSFKHQLSQSLLKQANFAAISGERESARDFLEKAMRDAPELEEAWILKAYLADDSQEKIACYEKILSLNPDNEAAQAGLASLMAIMQKSDEKKSNAEMLREVFETSGAGYLDSDNSAEISRIDSAEAHPDENFREDSAVKFISESYNGVEFKPESFENPTDELNAVFLDEVQAQGGFSAAPAEESNEFAQAVFENQSAGSAQLSVQPAAAVNENAAFASFVQTEEAGATAPEIELSEETNPFEENSEVPLLGSEESDNLSHQFSDQLPAVSNENFVSADENSTDEPQSAENAFGYEANAYSSENTGFENNSVSQADPEIENFATQKSAYDQENVQVELINETELTPKVEFDEEVTESLVHKTPSQADSFACPFCYVMNEPHAIVCASCRTMLSLSDLEMLLSHTEASPDVLAMAIEDLETEKSSRPLNAVELTNLGIAYLNAKNLRKALGCLQEASHLSPNDVVLASKANFLAIRLSEIEAHDNKMEGAVVKNLTVMVVDDSATVRKLISGKLEKCGHTVVTAADGAEALGKIKEIVPDLILLDIMMPEMDGYQVCKLIRSNEPTKDVPVVMISGKDGFFDKVRGRMAGTTGYIAKPFGPETLMKTIETYVL